MPTILVADDDVLIRTVLQLYLVREGFDVVVAADGDHAFGACRAQQPDVVITDLHMPMVNGFELCRRLQAVPSLQTMPVIMLTASNEHIAQETREELGLWAVVRKPFRPQELMLVVRQAVQATQRQFAGVMANITLVRAP